VRDGDVDAPWVDWQVNTTLITGQFRGWSGHTYTFRSRARDAAGNVEDWPAGPWEDTFTTVVQLPERLFLPLVVR